MGRAGQPHRLHRSQNDRLRRAANLAAWGHGIPHVEADYGQPLPTQPPPFWALKYDVTHAPFQSGQLLIPNGDWLLKSPASATLAADRSGCTDALKPKHIRDTGGKTLMQTFLDTNWSQHNDIGRRHAGDEHPAQCRGALRQIEANRCNALSTGPKTENGKQPSPSGTDSRRRRSLSLWRILRHIGPSRTRSFRSICRERRLSRSSCIVSHLFFGGSAGQRRSRPDCCECRAIFSTPSGALART
jgi:hypothetical protein